MTSSLLGSYMLPIKSFFNTTRLLYLTVCMTAGMYAGLYHPFLQGPSLIPGLILWGTIGLCMGGVALWMEKQLTACPRSALIGGSLGIIVGMAGTGLCILVMGLGLQQISSFPPWIVLPIFLFCPYLGLVVAIYIFQDLSLSPITESSNDFPYHVSSTSSNAIQKLLDSSAIIDGRVLPLCTTGFLEGPFSIPQCILHELQTLADSEHPFRRTKGKRGLEILSQLQQLQNLTVQVIDDFDPAISTVDHQLIAIAKSGGGKIITNDWNLAKIASLQGVPTLNVNELTYQLRPLVLPGEIIRVFIQKEGQGRGQGIAHLDDGTLVVVDDGAPLVGQAVEVVVTRFMQTNTGRMIFSSPHGDHSPFLFNPNPLTQFAR